ncbi:tRNA 2-thiouridine(34) synthase MnmA [Chlorobium phaeovibrioides]|uniref:tRNA-specific 2-thiouridylase MnmA n=1 Tax=Chlorobium phaeovibrioides TaxID=1094 RepID=A0A5M8ICA1_CHLPH|nr:tRNA 2-thiouridine(34) synthase MnmA [Chlorobium phaeovibrioides]KAA6232015.1 tRNA 2-thiouridine(34) synthase MnmA [Chlorobium phaeovibrioides]
MKQETTVLVGISGGVDSAVAACMLVDEGYRVIGLNIKVLDSPESNPALQPSSLVISNREEFRIPVYTLNLSKRFREDVIGYFQEEYLAARTPNPCIVCNKKIKWAGLLEAADMLNADLVATGHYASTAFLGGRCRLYQGADKKKDQSYFLWMLQQKELSKTILPLGTLAKPEVRELARSYGVPAAEKKESQEICFVPGDDYCRYLEQAIPDLAERVRGGKLVDASGRVIGHHRGYPFYTIGQRRGLGASTGEPIYVTSIDPVHNRIHTGKKTDLLSRELTASGMNWIGIEPPKKPFEATARIRYRDAPTPCRVTPLEDNRATISFHSPKSAITRGQAAVIYRDDEVLGGGSIVETTQ